MTWEAALGWPDGHKQRLWCDGPESMSEMLAYLAECDGQIARLERPWSKVIRVAIFSQEHDVDWSGAPTWSSRVVPPR